MTNLDSETVPPRSKLSIVDKLQMFRVLLLSRERR